MDWNCWKRLAISTKPLCHTGFPLPVLLMCPLPPASGWYLPCSYPAFTLLPLSFLFFSDGGKWMGSFILILFQAFKIKGDMKGDISASSASWSASSFSLKPFAISWEAFQGCCWLHQCVSVSSTNVEPSMGLLEATLMQKWVSHWHSFVASFLDNNKGVYYFREAIGKSFPSLLISSYR